MRLFLALFFTIQFIVSPAIACLCTEEAFSEEGSRTNIENAVMIFEGEIINVEPPPPYVEGKIQPIEYHSVVTFKILALYKGQKSGSEVTARFDTGSSCGYSVTKGDKNVYILYEYTDVLTVANQCSDYLDSKHLEALRRGEYGEYKDNQEQKTPSGK